MLAQHSVFLNLIENISINKETGHDKISGRKFNVIVTALIHSLESKLICNNQYLSGSIENRTITSYYILQHFVAVLR